MDESNIMESNNCDIIFNEIKKIIEDHSIQKSSEYIYHYTNEKNYNKICRDGFLILNSHHHLNSKDTSNQEIIPVASLITDMIKSDPTIKDQAEKFEQCISHFTTYYTGSFSNHDSLALSKYGRFCLRFKRSDLSNFAQQAYLTIFGDVIYGANKHKEIIEEIHECYKKYKPDQDSIDGLFIGLYFTMPLLKKESSCNEHECRLIQIEMLPAPWDKNNTFTKPISKKFSFSTESISIRKK
jgi:hypothetical protein